MTITFAGSERQAGFIVGMLAEIHGDAGKGQDAFDASVAAGKLSTREAVRNAIDWTIAKRDEFRAARKADVRTVASTVVAEHALEHGDCMTGTFGIARVVKAQAGHLYATKLEGEGAAADYVYWPGGIAIMGRDAELRKLTLAEAIALSAARSKCIRCNRKLKLAASIEAGMGKVCAGYFA